MTIAAVLLPALLAGLVQGVTGFGAGVLLMLFYPLLFSVAQSSAMSQCLCTVLCLSVLRATAAVSGSATVCCPWCFISPVIFWRCSRQFP